MAQLVEWSLLTPDSSGSNLVIDKIYIEHLFILENIEKMKIKIYFQQNPSPFTT